MAREENDRLDESSLAIIEAGYRSIRQPEAFDDLIDAWRSRIEEVAADSNKTLLTPTLSRHCEELVKVLDSVSDPLLLSEHDSYLRKFPGPAMVVSADGTVLAINQGAADRFGLAVGQRSAFAFVDPLSRSALEDLRLACRQQGNLRRAILQANSDTKLEYLDAQLITVNSSNSLVIGVRMLGYDWSRDVHDLLMAAFGLSEAEAEVVGLLYQNADLERVAELRGTSTRTVRTQLHQVFEKTNTTGQVELVRMVSLVCAQEGRDVSPIAEWRDPLNREAGFFGKSGRWISYSWMGAEDGTPAILCHGPITGHVLRPELIARLEQANIKLFSVIRPGFGHSTIDEQSPAHEAGADAICELADHLGLEGVVGVALVNGIIPLAFASARRPGLFTQLLGIGSTIPITPGIIDDLPPVQRTLFRLARQSEIAFEMFVQTGYRAVLASGPEYILARMYADSPADQRVLQNSDIFALLKASTAMILTQGHKAFLRDMQMSSIDFGPALRKCAPVRMLVGGHDPVYHPEQVKNFAEKTGIEVVHIEDAGQMVYHSHWEPMADLIEAAIAKSRI